MEHILDLTGLTYLWGKVKNLFATKAELAEHPTGKIYYGTCSTTANTYVKEATVETFPLDEDDKPLVGTVVAIKYSVTNTYKTEGQTYALNVNNTGTYPMYYNNAAVATSTSANTLVAGYKNRHVFYVFNGTQWVWLSASYDTDTTYSGMTQAEVDAGTGTTARLITPARLRDNFYTEDEVDTLLGSKANSNDLATVATSGSYNDLDDTPTIPTKVSDLTNDSGFTSNTGTITGITMNGVSKGTSGVVNLGTVLTEHQSLAGKQDVINDLATIRSGASAGATAIQPTDIKDELDPVGNGEIADSAAIAEYVEGAISGKVENVELRHGDTYILPYDAQVEYLQSSGTQYIDTGIIASQDLYSEVDCSIDNGTSDVTILGARSGSIRIYLLHRASSAFCIGYGGYYTGGTFANNTRYLAKTSLKPNIQTLDIDGTTTIQQNQSSNSTSINLYLFALNYSTKFYSNAKIWSCKIKQGDVLVRDFIPVRVGQVGYMYDKVSRQLFSNAGTGSFTFGNDIEEGNLQQTDLYVDDTNVGTLVTSYEPSPSARPYVAPSWKVLTNTIPTKVSDLTNDSGFTTNTGTITGITMNGASKGTSGVIDLGTVLTSQTKANWNETDSTSSAYIQNKPTIPAAVTEATVSGWGFTKNTGTLTTETDPVFGASAASGITSSNITSWNGKAEKIAEINHGTSDTTFALTPNIHHVWGEVTSLTLTLATGEAGIANEYMFRFYSGTTPTTLNLPSTVQWVQPLTCQQDKYYEVSIVDNLAVYITSGMAAAESSGGTPEYATKDWVTNKIETEIDGGYYYV